MKKNRNLQIVMTFIAVKFCALALAESRDFAIQTKSRPQLTMLKVPSKDSAQIQIRPPEPSSNIAPHRLRTWEYQTDGYVLFASNAGELVVAIILGPVDGGFRPNQIQVRIQHIARFIAGNFTTTSDLQRWVEEYQLSIVGEKAIGAKILVVDKQSKSISFIVGPDGRLSRDTLNSYAAISRLSNESIDYLLGQIQSNLDYRHQIESRLQYHRYLSGQYLSNLRWIETQYNLVVERTNKNIIEQSSILSVIQAIAAEIKRNEVLAIQLSQATHRYTSDASYFFQQSENHQAIANANWRYFTFFAHVQNYFLATFWYQRYLEEISSGRIFHQLAMGALAQANYLNREISVLRSSLLPSLNFKRNQLHSQLHAINRQLTEDASTLQTLIQSASQFRIYFYQNLSTITQIADYLNGYTHESILRTVDAQFGPESVAIFVSQQNQLEIPFQIFSVFTEFSSQRGFYQPSIRIGSFLDSRRFAIQLGNRTRFFDFREELGNLVCSIRIATLWEGNQLNPDCSPVR